MGNSRYDTRAFASYSTNNLLYSDGTRKAIHDTFTRREIAQEFNPLNITVRESRDSEANPNSRAIIFGLDVTGSMGKIAHEMANSGIPRLMERIIDIQPVADPHVMCIAIGDHRASDRSPIQATQFEADIKINEQIQDIYLEGGGGGNSHEAYDLAWYFASKYTSIDCFEKRGIKGYLFTIGDEPVAPDSSPTTTAQFKALFKDGDVSSICPSEMLREAQQKYEVFHIVVEEGSYFRHSPVKVTSSWTELLGKRVIYLDDYTKLADVVLAVIAVNEGSDPEDVIASAEGSATQNSIRHALGLDD